MRVSAHIRTHVVGYVAVFLALSGTAMALPGTNTVDSGDIVPSAVTTPDLGPDAVTAASIADGTVASADLFDQQVRRVDLKAAVVAGPKVENGSLGADEFVPGEFRSRFDETCGSQAWRFFRMTETFFNCASPVHEVENTFTTTLPGWRLTNGCHAAGHPILTIESSEDFGTVNWFYSDGTELHTGGIALAESDDVRFNEGPIWGQFILSNPGNGSSVPVNAVTLTFEGATCPAKASAAVGLL